jgi:hypothetical protein
VSRLLLSCGFGHTCGQPDLTIPCAGPVHVDLSELCGWFVRGPFPTVATPLPPFSSLTLPHTRCTQLSDHYRIMQLTEEMISGTSASRTSALVTALVQFIIRYAHIV